MHVYFRENCVEETQNKKGRFNKKEIINVSYSVHFYPKFLKTLT